MAKTLRIGTLDTVGGIDPARAQDHVSRLVLSQVFESPFLGRQVGEDSRPVLFGEALRDEGKSGDRVVYSAPVRDGVLFSDGTPLTPERLAEALGRVRLVRKEAEVEPEGSRIRFYLPRPNPRFDLFLSQLFCAATLERGSKLLGTGPYVIAEDSTPELMRLVRNPHCRRSVEIDELEFVHYPPAEDGSASALVKAINEGAVDFTSALPREVVSEAKNVRKYFEPGNSTAILYFNTEREKLSHPAARGGIARAIDRLELAQISYSNPLAFSAKGILPPFMSRFRDGISPSPEAARELLSQAGGPELKDLDMLLVYGPRPYLPHPRATAEAIAARLREVGIELSVRQMSGSVKHHEEIVKGDYDLALVGWIADTLDPADFLGSILSSSAVPKPGEMVSIHANWSRWDNQEFDALLRRFREDPTEGLEKDLLDLVVKETPVFPLVYGSNNYIHSFRVSNFKPDPLGIPLFHTLSLSD